jgi:phage terminase small subunit
LNLVEAAKAGKLHLIKSMKDTRWGISVELYDAQAALALLGKHHGLFVDRQEITGKDGIPLKVYVGIDPDAWDADNATTED